MATTRTISQPGGFLDGIAGETIYQTNAPLRYFLGGPNDTFFGVDPFGLGVQGVQGDVSWRDEIESTFDFVEHTTRLQAQETAFQQTSDISYYGGASLRVGGDIGLLGLHTFPGDFTLIGGGREGQAVGISLLNISTFDMRTPAETGGGDLRGRVVIHEIGHGLGLGHPRDTGNGTTLDLAGTDLDNERYTIMAEAGQSTTTAARFGHAVTFMALDIAALQHMYGVNTQAHLGNTTYRLTDAQTAPLDIDGADGSISIGRAYYAIWDAGGVDRIVYDGDDRVFLNLNEATLTLALTPGVDDDLLGLIDEVAASDAFAALSTNVQRDFTEQDRNAGGFFSQIIDGAGEATIGGFAIANGATIENAFGGGGDDILVGNDADNRLTGGEGDDALFGGAGADLLFGEAGADDLNGGGAADILIGGGGDDALSGGDADDRLHGGAGADVMQGGDGGDIYDVDNVGDQIIEGDTSGLDRINTAVDFTNPANVEFLVGIFAETGLALTGNDGRDRITGSNIIASGDDIAGQAGNDKLVGLVGDDQLNGGLGNDRIFGNSGDDLISGDAGNDRLTGQFGADTFIHQPGDGRDSITDFDSTQDVLDLRLHGFADIDAVRAALSDAARGAFLDLGGGEGLIFENLTVAGLSLGGEDVLI